jgi:GntR family transcriptional repressor for pyruvate dehydrogenase complex
MTTMRPTVDTVLFRPVKVGRASEDVVRQIKSAIHDGRIRPGDALPSERELTTHLGVSRVTVRDALRTLEATGLVRIRVGARGGAFVTAPEPDYIGEGLANMLLLSSSSPQDVAEARKVVELGVLPLVCERRTDEDLAALEEICTRAAAAVKAGDIDVGLSSEFHVRLAVAAHNTAIALIVDSFQGSVLRSLLQTKDLTAKRVKQGIREHRQLIDAVRRRDADAARDVMARHLG